MLAMYHKFIYWWVTKPISNFFVVHGFDGVPLFVVHIVEFVANGIQFVVYENHVPQIQSHGPQF
jgi:hypothetical protein